VEAGCAAEAAAMPGLLRGGLALRNRQAEKLSGKRENNALNDTFPATN
jgi:hypothetical protein